MLEIEPSTFCAICVSISVGAAPGSLMSTFTAGKDTSGLRLIGNRMKATTPMKNSTTNKTMGVTGCRIAHAEIFLMTYPHG
jgi:hypothetical protein